MGGETDSDVLFLIYTSSTAVGVENNSPPDQWVEQRFFGHFFGHSSIVYLPPPSHHVIKSNRCRQMGLGDTLHYNEECQTLYSIFT